MRPAAASRGQEEPEHALTAGGEVAVLGLARSGRAVAALLARRGRKVYASDADTSSELHATAARLRALGVDAEAGRHDLERIGKAALVVPSPGVPPDAAPLAAARATGVPVRSEVSVALDALPGAQVIAVTGTNGKSTTTAIIAHLLTALGRRAAASGNIGRALSELALEADPPPWIALEISSFQLHDTPDFTPLVGVLTNLAPDHLDRYPSVAAYYADKALMFAAAGADSRWVSNADDPKVARMVSGVAGRHYRFSLRTRADAYLDGGRGALLLGDRAVCARNGFPLPGDHNVANALAAVLAVSVALEAGGATAPAAGLGAALATFRGLPHRLEIVAERDGVQWINDSKATNVEAARMAVEAMSRPTILLLGGRHKGEPYTDLAAAIRRHVRLVIAYGEAAPRIERDLRTESVAVERLEHDFAAVVQRARELSRPGDAVLLAPACSSYDMFRDYEERGTTFRRLAAARVGDGSGGADGSE